MTVQKIFWGSNLKFLRERKKKSQQDLADTLAIGRSKLAAMESGATKNPPLEDQVKIADYFSISVDTMIRVDLSKLKEFELRELQSGNDPFITGTKLRVMAKTVSPDNNEQIEFVSQKKAKAGYVTGLADPDYIASLPTFHMPNLPRHKKFRMFQLSGDSMLPIPPDAYVIVEYVEDWTAVKSGTFCVVITKADGMIFKKVENHISVNRELTLISLNKTYQPYSIPASEILELWRYYALVTEQIPEPATDLEQILSELKNIRSKLK
ncbi:MAG TPA: LexA family transcriptional regulator [Chitinophaga sp.]|uniref:XRE family transcriptional regulator n=1 Tax=Chitinophaga sp. TaxID=1869181 RepID=UPI002D126DA6|nr:LexA family transcriptional regulator [Chitinophaga sp.]HVI46807.1 LexA family transcriptional regulator [Chitinophaga sp.]